MVRPSHFRAKLIAVTVSSKVGKSSAHITGDGLVHDWQLTLLRKDACFQASITILSTVILIWF